MSLVANIINREGRKSLELAKSRENRLGHRAMEVERQLLDLCALAKQLNQAAGHSFAVSDGGGRKRGLILRRCGDGELADVSMIGRGHVGKI